MATYFIRPVTGLDTNAGTSYAAAWKTINKAIASSAGGDLILNFGEVDGNGFAVSCTNADLTSGTAGARTIVNFGAYYTHLFSSVALVSHFIGRWAVRNSSGMYFENSTSFPLLHIEGGTTLGATTLYLQNKDAGAVPIVENMIFNGNSTHLELDNGTGFVIRNCTFNGGTVALRSVVSNRVALLADCLFNGCSQAWDNYTIARGHRIVSNATTAVDVFTEKSELNLSTSPAFTDSVRGIFKPTAAKAKPSIVSGGVGRRGATVATTAGFYAAYVGAWNQVGLLLDTQTYLFRHHGAEVLAGDTLSADAARDTTRAEIGFLTGSGANSYTVETTMSAVGKRIIALDFAGQELTLTENANEAFSQIAAQPSVLERRIYTGGAPAYTAEEYGSIINGTGDTLDFRHTGRRNAA